MKTIITASGNTRESQFDLRFGRAKYFCLYDSDNDSATFIENDNKDAQGGAGTKAAELAMEHNVKRIISGDFGPKAKKVLEKMDVQMVIMEDNSLSVAAIIDKIK